MTGTIPENRHFDLLSRFILSLNRSEVNITDNALWNQACIVHREFAHTGLGDIPILVDRHRNTTDPHFKIAIAILAAVHAASQGDLGAAIEIVNSLLQATSHHMAAYPAVLYLRGQYQRRIGRIEHALPDLVEAHRRFDALQWSLEANLSLSEVASCLLMTGDIAQAASLYLTALKTIEQVGEARHRSMMKANLAGVLLRSGHHARAEAIYLEVLDQPLMTRTSVERATILECCATISKMAHRYQDALDFYDEALACYNNKVWQHSIGLLAGKADVYLRTGDTEAARRILAGIDTTALHSLYGLAWVEYAAVSAELYVSMDMMGEARAWYLKAIESARTSNLQEELLNTINAYLHLVTDPEERLLLISEFAALQTERLDNMTAAVSSIVDVRANYEQERAIQERERSREQLRIVIETQDIVEDRIAADLHDSVGQDLTLVRMLLDRSIREAAPEASQSKTLVQQAIDRVVTVSHNIRQISHNLTGASLEGYQLFGAIQQLAQDIRTAWPDVHVSTVATGSLDDLDNARARCLYRCTQSLVQNILQHAFPSHVDIQLWRDESEIAVILEDDGIGFDPMTVTLGLGLQATKARLDVFMGQMDIDSTPGKGSYFRISIPFDSLQHTPPTMYGNHRNAK